MLFTPKTIGEQPWRTGVLRLPRSSLLMLVSALAGRERILAAYRHAVGAGYRFYSYGDAMLILPEVRDEH